MMAVQIDLLSGQPVAPSFESARELDERAKRQGFYPELFDVCEMCPDRECCCGDECRPLD